MPDPQIRLVYDVEDRSASRRDWALYSIQWLATMFYAVVLGYALVGVELGLEGDDLSTYMAAVVFTTGVATALQVWRGHRFAMVSGPNIIPSIAIITAIATGGVEYAEQAFIAQAIAGALVAAIAVTGLLAHIRRVFSPLVLGPMIIVLGIAIAQQSLDLLVQEGFGWQFWAGAALAAGGLALAIRGPGIWASLPPLLIVAAGYAVFIAAGDVDWDPARDAGGLVTPALFPFGLEWPALDLVAIMIVVNLMAVLNLYGNLAGYGQIIGREVTDGQMRRSFTLFGVVENVLPGVLGAPGTVAYGENLGIVLTTRVAARAFILVAAIALAVLAFIGPVVGLMSAMPPAVAGAVLLGVASAAVGIGVNITGTAPVFARREQAMVGFSVFFAVGLFILPDAAWEDVPRVVSTVFRNPIIAVIIFAVLLEQTLLRGTGAAGDGGEADDEDPAADRDNAKGASDG